MPDRMSNRMSEDMSDRMPEDLPVRKCINVMVGITRSKVIFFQWWGDFWISWGDFIFSRCALQWGDFMSKGVRKVQHSYPLVNVYIAMENHHF